jgi:hypothetical protein
LTEDLSERLQQMALFELDLAGRLDRHLGNKVSFKDA